MRSYLRTFLVLVVTVITFAVVVLDNYTTMECIARFNWLTVGEVNPFTRFLIREWGLIPALLANAVWSATLVLWLHVQATKNRSWFALIFMIGVILLPRGYAALHNMHLHQALLQ